MHQPNREPRRRRVAILVDEDFYYGRAIIIGITAHRHYACFTGEAADSTRPK